MNINMRSIILVGIALVIAGITAFMARSLIKPAAAPQAQQQVVKAAPAKVQVLVAAFDLHTGHFLKKDDLVWQSWPDDSLHENYVRKTSDFDLEQFAGAVVKNTIVAGEPLTESRIVRPGNSGFMAAVLPVGQRAVSIRVNATSGISGFIFPGDRVDILLTHKVSAGGKRKAQASETVLRNVRVLAIDQRIANPTHTPAVGKTVTLEVSPKDAEKISLVEKMGSLSLSLRSLAQNEGSDVELTSASPEDNSVTWDSEVSQLLTSNTGAPAAKGGKSFNVKVVRGNKVQQLGFTKQGN
ncbi:Flp pilus assembly protein CpaB [Emcibacter nanhaiensis]|uniref:Flp pilus assembly protein CpaB n=1 Tax=Emcibacter nanhaiensis TaxID=1505037 RepID=A0A501PCM6_9PROT|nr:Flp pilus assembly protein CpaB [Emcibacter nanhaiensis]TPD57716.1 Flp pilus assembly protein CpaB [Emcibacter nanhaiensis]